MQTCKPLSGMEGAGRASRHAELSADNLFDYIAVHWGQGCHAYQCHVIQTAAHSGIHAMLGEFSRQLGTLTQKHEVQAGSADVCLVNALPVLHNLVMCRSTCWCIRVG